jgi:DNA-directed RNA polymerase subunit RPC12/RpoP
MDVQCPRCHSEAVNKYGSVSGGKQRYICLVCDRQFIANPAKKQFKNRPQCPKCGKPMHSYMQGPDYIRFRCSDYPRCRTFLKTTEAEFETMWEGMISMDFSLDEFVTAVKGRPSWEVLYMANREATAAERLLIVQPSAPDSQQRKISAYIDLLTEFMTFMRSATKIPRTSKKSHPLFWQYWDSIQAG